MGVITDLLVKGEVKPLKIRVNEEMLSLLEEYRRETDGKSPEHKSEVWRKDKYRKLRAWVDEITDIWRHNWEWWKWLHDNFDPEMEDMVVFAQEMERWRECIRENESVCRKIGLPIPELFLEPLRE